MTKEANDDHDTIAAEIVGCFWSDAGNGEGLRNRIKHDLDSAYERGARSVGDVAVPQPDRRADLLARLALLKQSRRAGEPLTDRDGPTVEGHVRSAITKLERELERMRLDGGK